MCSVLRSVCPVLIAVIVVWIYPAALADENAIATIEKLAAADPKPCVIVESTGKDSVNRGQGVVISPRGHVLSAGHIAWDDKNKSFTDKFRVSFRGSGKGLPEGYVHTHETTFNDREDKVFFEHYYAAKLTTRDGTRFIGKGDLALFTIKADGKTPHFNFYSKQKPKVGTGDVFHLCHFVFPHKPGDPTFLINPVEVVGVADTPSGIQYLAKGYYRVGSSGGAILKQGKLIGIQSAAYTVNAKDIGEIPVGLISFQLVWSDLVAGQMKTAEETKE